MPRKTAYDDTIENAQEVPRAVAESSDRAMEPLRQGASRAAQLCWRVVQWTQQVELAQLEGVKNCSAILLDAVTQMDGAASRDALAQASAEIWRRLVQQSRQSQDVVARLSVDLNADMLRLIREQDDDVRESLLATGRILGGPMGTVPFDPLATVAQVRTSLDQWIALWNSMATAGRTHQP
jgi:hypothetical protein